jgi:hypothetical protein
MHPHEIHHIKTYIVFFILSASLIGLLAYLYIPIGTKNTVQSSVIQEALLPPATVPPQLTQTQSMPNVITPVGTGVVKTSETDVSVRRMRLVKILLRSQQELKTLEGQRSASPK